MSDVRLKVYFSEGDKEEAYADDFSDVFNSGFIQ